MAPSPNPSRSPNRSPIGRSPKISSKMSKSQSPTIYNRHTPPPVVQMSRTHSSMKSGRDLTRHSPPPSMHSDLSRSPIRDVINLSLADNSDDEDDEDEIEDVLQTNDMNANDNSDQAREKEGGKRSPPQLASTYSSSSHDGSNDNAGGHDHADEANEGGGAASNATNSNALSRAALERLNAHHTDTFKDQPSLMNMHKSPAGGMHNNSPSVVSSGISKWRRSNMHIQTQQRSSFSLANTPLSDRPNTINSNSRSISNNSHNPNNSCYNSSNALPITPLHQIPYVHGGYAAAAPLFVTHSKFASILKKLLPGAYDELSCLLRKEGRVAKGRGKESERKKMERGTSDATNTSANSNGSGNRSEGDAVQGEAENADGTAGVNESNGEYNSCNNMPPKANLKRISSCTPTYRDVAPSSSNDSNTLLKEDGPTSTTPEVILPDPVKVMKWAENNPVVSAFGIWNSDSGRRTIKFMQGIQLHNNRGQYDNEDIDRQSMISGYTESVVTLGSNTGFNSNFGYRNVGNPHHVQRPKRRKQPLPEDVSTSDSGVMDSSLPQPQPSYSKPALEWDVFLDPNLVRQVDAAMSVADSLELKLRKSRIRRERKAAAARALNKKQKNNTKQQRQLNPYNRSASSSNKSSVSAKGNSHEEDRDEVAEEDDDDFDILQAHTAAQVEVDRLVSQLMRRTILAHGSMSQLVLEAMGVAPSYNFGTVVKSSRDGVVSALERSVRGTNNNPTSPSSPSRSTRVSLRAGNTEFSVNMTQTLSWDEDEEQRDFEALLDPSMSSSNAKGGKSTNRRRKAGISAGSKGMFMESWLHVFARTLSLLVKSSDSSGGNNNIVAKSSSESSKSNASRNDQRLLVQNRPANIGQRGLSGLLEKMFFRRDSSYPDPSRYISGASVTSDTNVETVEENPGNDSNNTPDIDDDNSDLLSNNDMFMPTTPTASTFGSLCGMSLCLGMDESTNGGASSFPINKHASHKMAQDIEKISTILGEPLRLVLDLKSRRVPPRVWSRLIDSLRTRGLIVEGIGSFDMDELRVIGKGCSYPLTPILFFHSVGDLQRACHANEVKNGDTVYFNGGSLMWKRSTLMEAAERGCCGTVENADDATAAAGDVSSPRSSRSGYSFQPYAYPRLALSDWERTKCKSTIEDYRRHFNLKLGVYVQEFSISAEALDALSIFVNKHGNVYDQGLAFGGVNGTAIKNIKGDGYWNQRYMGRAWDFDARPSKEMAPLKPEDHHLVQKAIQAGAWGNVGTIYEIAEQEDGALTLAQPHEPLRC